MEHKYYESCAKDVVMIIKEYTDQFAEIGEALELCKKDNDRTISGKVKVINGLREELNTLNQTESDKLKEVITEFCNHYHVFRADEKPNAMDVANALKVIEVCGSGLTLDVLKSAVEPLLKSHSSLEMLDGVLRTKGCGGEVLDYMMELTYGNNDVITYENQYETINSLLNVESIFNGSIPQGSIMGELPGISDGVRYEVFALADSMMNVGKMHDVLSLEYPGMFK